MKQLKIGIIGCGGIANNKHLPTLKVVGKTVDLIAFCDLIPARAQEAAATYGTSDAKVFTDYHELLKQDLDAVYVLTPNNSHAPITIAALDAGCHVLCEKPMAATYSEARAMCEAAARNGKSLTIGYQNRYRADSQYLKGLIEDGDLGDIYFARAPAIRRRGVPTWGVFLDAEKQGGGPLIDIGTHSLDLTLWLMNNYEPEMVVGAVYRKLADNPNAANIWGPWDPTVFTVEDSAFGMIRFKNGATVLLETAWAINLANPKEAATVLAGTKGGADMEDGLRINGERNGKLYLSKPDLAGGGVDFYAGEEPVAAEEECKVFLSHLQNGTPLTVLPDQAAVVTKVLEAVYASAKSGKPVYFVD